MTSKRGSPEVVIIGAGPAGIGAGLALGEQALVLDRRPHAGGLCETVVLDGAVFDLGGHSFHTPHPDVRRLVFDALPMEEQPRQASCFVKGEWVPYPFQANFTSLRNEAVIAECREGLEARDASRPASNLDEHLRFRHGEGIARHFLGPYNEKLWGRDLTRLSADWTAERIANPGASSGRGMGDGGARTPLQADSTIAYPAKGGYGEIFRALAARLPRVRFDETVAAIDPWERSLTTSRGERVRYTNVVSTLPLPRLLDLLPDVPEGLRASVDRLVALPLVLVLLALETRLETPMQRVYCPGDEIPAHKLVLNHNSSSSLRSLSRHGVLAEVSAAQPVLPAPELTERLIESLVAMGLLENRGQVRNARIIEVPFGYPVPTHERATIVAAARAWLEERDIHTLGRFGEWAYINADEALFRGLEMGARLAAPLTSA
jgi:protoporphyrinogen oxidase